MNGHTLRARTCGRFYLEKGQRLPCDGVYPCTERCRTMTERREERYTRLRAGIRDKRSLLVSYSGGIDSLVLAIVAREVLGNKSACCLITSPLLPPREEKAAREIAAREDLRLFVRESPILEDPAFRMNPKDRCAICKQESARILREVAAEEGFAAIADGTNADDITGYRPGYQTGRAAGITHPFVEAGITKADIRAIAKMHGVPEYNKPSASCLATRVEYGACLEPALLGRIARAEEVVRAAGGVQVRVRVHDACARIETDPASMERIFALRDIIAKAFHTLGFRHAALDMDGFQSGSMDETGSDPRSVPPGTHK